MKDNEFISTAELAKLLGVSRVTVFKKIKSGNIKAQRAGRSFIIARTDLPEILKTVVKKDERHQIEQAVKKTIHDYKETLRLLGKE